MSALASSEDELPSKLRAHIQAESLHPDRAIFQRSLFATSTNLLLPHFFIVTIILLSRSELLPIQAVLVVGFLFLLAAQRAMQTLVHDLSHKLVSRSTSRNDLLGNYIIAGWIGGSVPAYRLIHMQHHKYNGSADDPEHIDFDAIKKRGGLIIHCLRYIFCLEALRLINKYYGKSTEDKPQSTTNGLSSKLHIIVCQIILASLFVMIAEAWYLYLLWLYIAVSWNPLLSNLRFLVEHPGETDLTVSTPGSWLERLYFAPFNFNFHLEHHLWPNVPPYRLAAAHSYLLEREYFTRHPEFLGTGFIRSLRLRN